MESPSTVQGVSFKQKLWNGQRDVLEALEHHKAYLNIQLPTGYGKTFTAACCYAIKQKTDALNRLLVVFPTDAQLEQFERDSTADRSDLVLASIEGPLRSKDVRFNGADAIRAHRNDTAQIFTITIQSLIQSRGDNNIRDLMQTGRWMLVVDEYHHYGIEKAWGKSVRSLPASFVLAMSATPTRPTDDSAFGPPHIQVSYRDAAKEGKVKPLWGHAYHYRIDALDPGGVVHSYTTSELADAAGDSPNDIEKWRIERKMRWSPKYISPLITHPLERMRATRLKTGCGQALIGAMCVSHAELVCEQIRSLWPELAVDWVGTGINGRTDAKNKEIIETFCPKKDADGIRRPTLDVLVHVGMAGEGLDSTMVTEVVHVNHASRNNSNNQENGRAARLLLYPDKTVVTGHINFDGTSEYCDYVGDAIMDAMDGCDPRKPEEPPPPPPDEWPDPPEDPPIFIYNMELEYIDSGDPGVQRLGRHMHESGTAGYDPQDIADRTSPNHQATMDRLLVAFRNMRLREAELGNEKSVVMQYQDRVNDLLATVVGRTIRLMVKNGQRIEKSLPGDIKKRINTRKKFALGEITRDVAVLKAHYQWLRNLYKDIHEQGVPPWLS